MRTAKKIKIKHKAVQKASKAWNRHISKLQWFSEWTEDLLDLYIIRMIGWGVEGFCSCSSLKVEDVLWDVSHRDTGLFLWSIAIPDLYMIFPHHFHSRVEKHPDSVWWCARNLRRPGYRYLSIRRRQTGFQKGGLWNWVLWEEVGNPTHIRLVCQWRNGLWSLRSTWFKGDTCVGYWSSTSKGSDHSCGVVFPSLH